MIYFRLNAPDVVEEDFEGEVVLIHFGNGRYFSLNSAGSRVLQGLAAGYAEASVAGALARASGADPALAAEGVARLREILVREEILVEGSAADAGQPSDAYLTWEEPALTPYTDMTELLLLDPVHEADPSLGWPHQPKA